MAFGMIKQEAGDFKDGNYHQFLNGKYHMKVKWKFFKKKYKSNQVVSLEVASEENVSGLPWGAAGLVAFGGLGLIAGLMTGGKKVTFVLKFNDGMSFMGTTTQKVYTQMNAAFFKSNKNKPVPSSPLQSATSEPELSSTDADSAQSVIPNNNDHLKKNILSVIISWLIGLFLIFTSLGFLKSSALGGAAILIAGLLFLPPIHNYIFSKTNLNIHWALKSILAVGFMFYTSLNYETTDFQADTESINSEIKENISNKDHPGSSAIAGKFKSVTDKKELHNFSKNSNDAVLQENKEKAQKESIRLKAQQELKAIELKVKEAEEQWKIKETEQEKKELEEKRIAKEEAEKRAKEMAELAEIAAKENAEKRAKAMAELEQNQADKLNEKKKAYLDQVNREMESLKTFSVKKYLESKDSIIIGVALFSVWAKFVEEGESFDLNKKESDLLKKFKAKISSVQTRSFPKLRDSYGPAIRQSLWEHDLSAKTIGKGYRTLELVGGAFAANRNIKKFQEAISTVVHQLRFKKVNYKWYKGAREFTYYDIKSHNDSQLIIWTEGDSFREVKK